MAIIAVYLKVMMKMTTLPHGVILIENLDSRGITLINVVNFKMMITTTCAHIAPLLGNRGIQAASPILKGSSDGQNWKV